MQVTHPLTYKVNEGQIITYLLFITFFLGQLNFIYIFGLNINFLVTGFLLLIILIKNRIFKNIWFLAAIMSLTFFLLLNIDYYSVYFFSFYLTIIMAFFIGNYSPEINLPDMFKKLFLINLILNVIFYFLVTHTPFAVEGGKQRLVSISGGPPATSFVYLTFFLFFFNYKFRFLAFFSLVLLILTGNRITILTSFFVIILNYLMNISIRKFLIISGSFILLVIIIISTNLGQLFLEKARFLDKNGSLNLSTFQGRLVHWKWAIIHFDRSTIWGKLFGHGINSTKRIFFTTYTYNGEKTGSGAMHNEFLRILTENGLLGVLIVLGVFMYFFIVAIKRKDFVLLCLVSAVFITSLTDNTLYSYYNYLTIIFFLIGYHLKYRYRNHATL
jgi:O-antigen ligase